jgi:hypothetical protein
MSQTLRPYESVKKDVKACAGAIDRAVDAGYWEVIANQAEQILKLYREAREVLGARA